MGENHLKKFKSWFINQVIAKKNPKQTNRLVTKKTETAKIKKVHAG